MASKLYVPPSAVITFCLLFLFTVRALLVVQFENPARFQMMRLGHDALCSRQDWKSSALGMYMYAAIIAPLVPRNEVQ